MSNELAKDLKQLGSGTTYNYDKPDVHILETFPNPMGPGSEIEITAPEVTSLCPKTGQPDFAEFFIAYIPRDKCVESKSLKLYLGAFRQEGIFHEAFVERVFEDLMQTLDPQRLRVEGRFTPRGGIKFWPNRVYRDPLMGRPED